MNLERRPRSSRDRVMAPLPLHGHTLVLERYLFGRALRQIYDNDPDAFHREGLEHPRLQSWCLREGVEPARMAGILARELVPLHPDGEPGTLPSFSEEDMATLGATLADMALSASSSSWHEIALPAVTGWLVGSLPPNPGDERWPEERLSVLGGRHPPIAALLHAYDQALRGKAVRARNRQASLWQLLWRHLRAWRVRRIAGFAVEPLLSLDLRVEAAKLDDELLHMLGRVVLAQGEVVMGATKFAELVTQAQSQLGRKPVEPAEDPEPSLKGLEREALALAEDLDAKAAALDMEALVVLRPRGPATPPTRVVIVACPEPADSEHTVEAGEAPKPRAAPPVFPLPWGCRECSWSEQLRRALLTFSVTLGRDVTTILSRDGPATVPT